MDLLYCYEDLINLHYKHQNFIINISICSKLHIFAQFKSLDQIELFFLYILTVSDYMRQKPWRIESSKNFSFVFRFVYFYTFCKYVFFIQ